MDAVKKKSFWIVLIVIIAVFIVIQLIIPKQRTTNEANLVIKSDTEIPIGAIHVDFSRLDGTSESAGVSHADGSMIMQGDTVYFFDVRWPTIVTIYKDVKGDEVLTQLYIEQAPDAQCRWEATLYDGDEGMSLSMESVPKEQK